MWVWRSLLETVSSHVDPHILYKGTPCTTSSWVCLLVLYTRWHTVSVVHWKKKKTETVHALQFNFHQTVVLQGQYWCHHVTGYTSGEIMRDYRPGDTELYMLVFFGVRLTCRPYTCIRLMEEYKQQRAECQTLEPFNLFSKVGSSAKNMLKQNVTLDSPCWICLLFYLLSCSTFLMLFEAKYR